MAFQAAANATQRVGNYAPGSLAAQPRRFAGGVRKRGESPDQMANRMDAGYMASAMQGGTSATPTRADNIAKARADGTFDAKRNAFNAANSGSFMDAAGNIGPKAEMPTSPASTPPSPAPPFAPAPNPTATAPAKPKGPATFDGKPKADFFGAAMNKYGPTAGVSAYKDQGVMAVAANGGKPMPAPKPAPAVKPAGMVAATQAPAAKPYSGPMARPPGQVDAKPGTSKATPASKPAGIVAAASTKAPANGFSPELHRRFDPTTTSIKPSAVAQTQPNDTPSSKPASPRLDAAQAQAVKNPQGLSARLNPPGAKPVPLSEDPIAKPLIAGGKAIARGFSAAANAVGSTISQQAAKNPTGLTAKLSNLFSPKKKPAGFMAAATP